LGLETAVEVLEPESEVSGEADTKIHSGGALANPLCSGAKQEMARER
jgi:hypothetical protein